MAVDVTGATGQKPSRSARSQTARLAQPEARVQRRDFKREVSAPLTEAQLGSDSGLLAGALSDFFGSQVPAQIKRDEVRKKEENRQEIMRIQAAVNADRPGARRAMMTGDTSGFVTPSLANRRAVFETFQSITAKTMADDDYTATVQEDIRNLGVNDDPQRFIENYIKEQSKGGSPIFERDYAATIMRRANPDIVDFKKQREKVVQAQSQEGAVNEFKASLTNGDIPNDITSFNAALTRMVGAMARMGPADVLEMESKRDLATAQLAANGDLAAQRFLIMPDPSRDGTSIDDRNPGLYAKAVAASLAKYRASLTVAAATAVDANTAKLDQLLTTGVGDIGTLYKEFKQIETKHDGVGTSPTYKAARRRYIKAMASLGSANGSLDSIATGNAGGMGNTAWAKLAHHMLDPKMAEAAAERTGEDATAVALRFRTEYARRGGGEQARDRHSTILLTSSDAEQVQKEMKLLSFSQSRRAVPMSDRDTGLLTPLASGLFHFMSMGENAQQPMIARQQFLDAQRDADGKLDTKTHYRKALKDTKGGTNGIEGETKVMSAVWDAMALPEARNFIEADPEVHRKLREAVNMASAVGSFSNDEGVVKLATSLMQNELGMEWVDGEIQYTLDRTPPYVIGPKGNLIPGVRADANTMDRIEESFESDEMVALDGLMSGSGINAQQDERTSSGHGMAMTAGLAQRPISFGAGKVFGMDFVDLPKGLPPALMQMIETDDVDSGEGTMIFRGPPAPTGGEPITKALGKNLFLLYDRSTNQWSMRWKDAAARQIDVAAVSAKNKAMRAKLATSRPSGQASINAWAKAAGMPAPTVQPTEDLAFVDEEDDIMNILTEDHGGTQGLLGSPVAPPEYENPVSPREVRGVEGVRVETIENLTGSKFVSSQAVQQEENLFNASNDDVGFVDRIDNTIQISRDMGGSGDDLSTRSYESFDGRTEAFIANEEGYSMVQYDDSRKSGMWREGSSGNPTIGFGYNLKRPRAREELKRVGLDLDKVLAGKQQATKEQSRELLRIATKQAKAWVNTEFGGDNLADHQKSALISLVYNGKWSNGRPVFMGPKLTAAIRAKDWVAAGYEIAQRSENVSARWREGIHARRVREATLFLGPTLAAQVDYLVPFTPF